MKTLPVSGNRGASFGVGVPLARAVRAGWLALGLMLSSTAASADPVRVVTDGFFGSGGDDTGLWVVGSNFDLATGARPGASPVVTCDPCTPGAEIDLSATVSIRDWGPGSATLDGRTYATVYYGGSLVFSAGSVIVPGVPPQPAGLDETAIVPAFTTFTFAGTLSGFADPSLTGAPLFSVDLAGSGSGPFAAIAGFGNLGAGVFLDYVDYRFDEGAPVPEPGSLLLFGSGAAWVAARCRRRRQQGAMA